MVSGHFCFVFTDLHTFCLFQFTCTPACVGAVLGLIKRGSGCLHCSNDGITVRRVDAKYRRSSKSKER